MNIVLGSRWRSEREIYSITDDRLRLGAVTLRHPTGYVRYVTEAELFEKFVEVDEAAEAKVAPTSLIVRALAQHAAKTSVGAAASDGAQARISALAAELDARIPVRT